MAADQIAAYRLRKERLLLSYVCLSKLGTAGESSAEGAKRHGRQKVR